MVTLSGRPFFDQKGATAELARYKLPAYFLDIETVSFARRYYYHPSQQGSWSIKSVLPGLADDLSHDDLEGVQDGGAAMAAYLEALHPETAQTRKEEIRQQLLAYCTLDTLALVRLWQSFSSRQSAPSVFMPLPRVRQTFVD